MKFLKHNIECLKPDNSNTMHKSVSKGRVFSLNRKFRWKQRKGTYRSLTSALEAPLLPPVPPSPPAVLLPPPDEASPWIDMHWRICQAKESKFSNGTNMILLWRIIMVICVNSLEEDLCPSISFVLICMLLHNPPMSLYPIISKQILGFRPGKDLESNNFEP